MKKVRYLIVLLLIFCEMGCKGEWAGIKETEEIGSAQREELKLWSYYETEAQIKGLNQLMEAFNSSQEKYSISWEYVPMTEFDRRISRAYTEQELPDLVIIDNPDMLRFIQLGMFEDITNYAKELSLEDTYYEASVGTVQYKDHYYGVPFNSNNVCLIYNRELFEEFNAEVPGDWESFYETANQMTTDQTTGFLMCCLDSEQGAFQLLEWILSETENPAEVDEKGLLSAFEFLDRMIREGILPAGCLNYSQTDVARRFAKGDIAMIENGPWVFSMLDQAGIQYGLAPMPEGLRRAVILGGENLGIIKGKNVEGSIAFIRYCMEKGGIEEFCKTSGLLPSRIASAENTIEENSNFGIIAQQMEYAVARNDITEWNSISRKITSVFSKMVAGDLSPEQAAKEVLQ